MKAPLLLPLTASLLFAQSTVRREFEVATVKPSSPASKMIGIYIYPGGRIRAENCQLQHLIEEAFGLGAFQISGGPNWIKEALFDIEARPPATSKSIDANPRNRTFLSDEQRLMLQALLTDRFHLEYHRETKEGPVYVLSKGKRTRNLPRPRAKMFLRG